MTINSPNMTDNRPGFESIPAALLSLLCILLLTSFTFAQRTRLSEDELLIASSIKALRSENIDIRTAAAKVLRRVVRKYPSGNTNIRSKDGGKAFWTKRVNQVVAGMAKSEVMRLLPPFAEAQDLSGIGTGQSHYVTYRLDHDWMVRISYRNSDEVIKRPELIARELSVYVAPPPDFSGTWVCWHVNGQKAYEIQFTNGKYEGVFTRFHDNGRKAFEQHYVAHEVNGADTGWYPDGRVMYTGLYKNGKKDGKWIHLFPDGRKSSESTYKDGERNGLFAQWYENGQIRLEMNYKHGVQHGNSAAWNEQGVLQYRREYNNGKVIE